MTAVSAAQLAGVSAWIAAAATVVGMVTLVLFFSRGGRWGPANDASSVVLMLAMIPVALVLAVIESEVVTTIALVVAIVGIAAMLAVAVLQALLVVGRVTFEGTKVAVLSLGAVVGAWYALTALVSGGTDLPDGLRLLALVAGVGLIGVGYGFLRGGERHPASVVGGLLAFVGSLGFQVWLGWLLVSGTLTVPEWNA